MKHLFLRSAMAAFAITAISSCSPNEIDHSQNGPGTVKIKTKNAGSRGNKPDVVPRCAELKYGTDQEVVWEIDQADLGFTVSFKEGKSPFDTHKFDNEHNKSGPAKKDPGEKDQVYMYSIKVDGFGEIDPAVIIWK